MNKTLYVQVAVEDLKAEETAKYIACGAKVRSVSMIMSVNMLDLLHHIYPQWTGGQNDWPSPTWPRLSPGICWSVIEQDTEHPPAPGCCSAAQLALWPYSVREGVLPLWEGVCYLSGRYKLFCHRCMDINWRSFIPIHLRSKILFFLKHQYDTNNKGDELCATCFLRKLF